MESRASKCRIVAFFAIASLCALALPAPAQESASFRIRENVLNMGGHPRQGDVLGSASYRMSLDSLGEGAVRFGLSSPSFKVDSSFSSAYPPPGEVGGLRFADATTLVWSPERSTGSYSVYRDSLASLGAGYGACWQPEVVGESATDTDPVPRGEGFFYLVTANNRLREEGSKGRDSAGAERGGDACP